jgi:hypothetical protein
MSLSEDADALAQAIEQKLGGETPPDISDAAMQRLLGALIRTYGMKFEADPSLLPVSVQAGRITPTDIMVTASRLLKAGNLQVFELGMWQSWTGS